MTKKDLVFYDQKRGTAVVAQEKRVLSRIPMDRTIVVVLPDDTFAPGRIINYSGSGALIAVKVELEKNQIIELKMDEKKLPFARAMVLRIATPGKEFGVRWIEFFPEQLPKGLLTRTTM